MLLQLLSKPLVLRVLHWLLPLWLPALLLFLFLSLEPSSIPGLFLPAIVTRGRRRFVSHFSPIVAPVLQTCGLGQLLLLLYWLPLLPCRSAMEAR